MTPPLTYPRSLAFVRLRRHKSSTTWGYSWCVPFRDKSRLKALCFLFDNSYVSFPVFVIGAPTLNVWLGSSCACNRSEKIMDRRPLYSLYSMIFVIPQRGTLTSQDGPCFVLQRSIFDGITNIVEYNEYNTCFHHWDNYIDIYRRYSLWVEDFVTK